MDDEIQAEARALYERNCLIAPKWEDLGQVTRDVWIERIEQRRALPDGVPANRAACEVERDAAKCWREPCAAAGACTAPIAGVAMPWKPPPYPATPTEREALAKRRAALGVPACPESGKHCRPVDGECQTCGASGVPASERARWTCLLCKSLRPGYHGTLDDKVTPCPNGVPAPGQAQPRKPGEYASEAEAEENRKHLQALRAAALGVKEVPHG